MVTRLPYAARAHTHTSDFLCMFVLYGFCGTVRLATNGFSWLGRKQREKSGIRFYFEIIFQMGSSLIDKWG